MLRQEWRRPNSCAGCMHLHVLKPGATCQRSQMMHVLIFRFCISVLREKFSAYLFFKGQVPDVRKYLVFRGCYRRPHIFIAKEKPL